MDYRLDYHDINASPVILAQPNRDTALRQARKLTTGNDRIVYVIGAKGGKNVGSLTYAQGRKIDSDGDTI